ncbi:hypothetical protein [Bradyrhizobium erythrophlei]|uniref:Uncharacterized protein n=1 Tax=Bradyrhizobium erythrophlei TaxID=1437360 RepID=A0A1H4ML69_9BRAD|nr:hypothetical protein [Bradyrhizobium erythrophlei]SEB83514.1 hypothetical protein SAMN05444164_0350 [Bradyrhizobium erythrophlei]
MQMHMDTVPMPVNPPDTTEEGVLAIDRDEARPRVPKYRKQPHAKEQVAAGTRKSGLTRRANQRYISIIPK